MAINHSPRLHIALFAALLLILGAIVPVLAQQGTTLTLGAVDSSAFPQVHVSLMVNDALGASVANLTAADFQVFEDGIKVPATSIAVALDESQPLSLVLAVDISTEAADLERVKDGLLGLVDGLRPGDDVQLLSFFDEVRVEQAATTDLEAVRTAIRRLSVTGSFTALNRAAVEAINRANVLANPRKTVVIVTDSVENFETLSADDVAGRANNVNLPVYLIAFSPKVQAPGVIDSFAQQLSARPFILATATEAQLRLQTLVSLFGRGYRLTYISSLPADGADHTLSINLAAGSAADRADTILRALPGQVLVEFPDLSNGQQVGGVIRLSPQIDAPGAVARVDYTLDGQPLASVETSPFDLDWDSSAVSPGSHVVGVRVQDQAGNSAERFLTVQVVDPLTISVSTTQERLFVGDEITVIANVEALKDISAVDFYLNNIRLDSIDSPPYQIVFDSSGYDPGAHILAVQVTDSSGYSERAEFSMPLAAAPPRFLMPADTWLRVLAIGSIVLAIVLAWLILTYAGAAGRRRRRARLRLSLQNQGNMASAYLLRVDDPAGRFEFQFLYNGLVLRGRQVVEWVDTGQRQMAERPPAVQRQPASQPPAALQAQPAAAGRGGLKLGQLSQRTSQFGQVMGVVWGLFGSLARFLPKSMGRDLADSVARQTGQIYANTKRLENVNQHAQAATRLAQGQSRSAAQTPEQYHAQVQGQPPAPQAPVKVAAPTVPQLAPQATAFSETMTAMVPVSPVEATAQAPLALPQPNGTYTNGHGANGATGYLAAADGNLRYDSEGRIYKKVVRRVTDSNWTETPEVEAGDTLNLELIVEPKRIGRTRHHNIRISSKAMAEPGTPLHIEESSVKIGGISFLNWFVVPLLVVVATAAVVLFMVHFLLVDFGLITGLQLPWPLF